MEGKKILDRNIGGGTGGRTVGAVMVKNEGDKSKRERMHHEKGGTEVR